MQVDLFITKENGAVQLETAFYTIQYNIDEVCRFTLKYMPDFKSFIIAEYDEDGMLTYDINLSYMHDDDKYDLIHDLVYYFGLKPL
jgi:hypothetical protein